MSIINTINIPRSSRNFQLLSKEKENMIQLLLCLDQLNIKLSKDIWRYILNFISIPIIEKLHNSPKPALIVSFNIDLLNKIAKYLKSKKISSEIYDGTILQTQMIINNYNNGKLDVLLMSPNQMNGISLKNTRQLHAMEGTNDKIISIVQRVQRLGSHDSLPENERNIMIYKWHIDRWNK